MTKLFLTTLLALAGCVLADDGLTAYVNLGKTRGVGSHNASAFIYGMPLNYNPNQIPDHYYSDIGIKWGRSGGGQLDNPCRGWAFGPAEYSCRFKAMKLNYLQTRKFGAQFFMLAEDLWGVDYKTSIPNYTFPGDNGNWSSYDAFVKQLISDVKTNGILPGLIWEIWNEPDQSGFWGRSTQQWVDMYIRTHKVLRADPGLKSMLIAGPTLAASPDVANYDWSVWGQQVSGNKTYPDMYTWHYEMGVGSSDPDISNPLFQTFLATYKLPYRPPNINEYATLAEMTPSGYSFWISRLERWNYAGLLGIWNPPLYDNFANLLTKYPGDPEDTSNLNYTRAAGFPVYQYYAAQMVGQRATTTGSTNGQWDCFATIGQAGDQVRILAGSRAVTGNFTIQIQNLPAVGQPSSGTLHATYYAFYGSDNIFDPFGDPPYLGVQSVPIVNGIANLNVYVPDLHTGWRIEFPVLT